MFILPELAYPYEALEPTVSAETMRLHHDKHHAKYVETANKLLAEAGERPASLEDVVRRTAGGEARKLFNNAAQAWNHGFFWDCMTPAPSAPEGELALAIDKAFGSLDGLAAAFVKEGAGHFGSGWVWLAAEGEGLKVLSTHDGDNLLPRPGLTPLLVCDLWEHAYYVDYRNDRKAYLEAWFGRLANWPLAAAQWAAAQGGGEGWRYPPPAELGRNARPLQALP